MGEQWQFLESDFTVPEGAYIRLGTTDVAAYEQVIIKKEYELPLVSSPALIVDAGANVGMASVYFALRYPGACIIALEPDGANVRALMENARRFQNIQPIKCGALGEMRICADDRPGQRGVG